MFMVRPPHSRWLQGLAIVMTILTFHSINLRIPNILWVVDPTTLGIVGLTVLAGVWVIQLHAKRKERFTPTMS